jgi:pyruvate kinase
LPEADTTGHTHADTSAIGDATGALVRGAHLATVLQVGDRVLLADGAAELKVSAIEGSEVLTEVVSGGLIRSRCGVSIPSGRFGDGGLTDADRAAVPRALELRVDLLAQSFVRSAADVHSLRALLPTDGPRVVAKIETRAALDDFDAICAASDGIMVARGDLGVDVPFESVPMIQKDLVRRATAAGRFSIVATQMLESMTGSPRPTRAEASDVANAVLDGADAVMLSAETAIGAHPVEALSAMERICRAAELPHAVHTAQPADPSAALVLAAATLAASGGVSGIWCFTRSGRTAELLSLYRPPVPVVAFTLSPIVARRLAVRSGVIPLVLPAGAKNSPLIEQMEGAWRAQRSGADHDTVLLLTTSSQPQGINRLEIHRLSGSGRGK